MSTNKHIDKICCVVLIFTLLITVLFMNAESFGIQKASAAPGYENRLFDTSYVHTIDIVMDDWDSFLSTCKNEEYSDCTVVVDGEAYKNVAIRAKGNTSLTQVESYGNNRYSFKIEFDHYDSSNTYHGLDKLCLNNIIQDNTYMKDYLTYQMMSEMGVASPLCSYVNISVNNETWGLYLAVEGIEESFLRRNYGNDYGELYKPDSMDMGGGRGNGKDFEMEGWEGFGNSDEDSESETLDTQKEGAENTETESSNEQMETSETDAFSEIQNIPEGENSQIPPEQGGGQMPGGSPPPGFSENGAPDGMSGGMPQEQPGDMPGGMPQEQPGDIPDNMPQEQPGDMPDNMQQEQSGDMPDDMQQEQSGDMPDDMQKEQPPSGGGRDKQGGPGQMGSDDVLLKYIDDEFDSYSNIFENAKTDISDSDKERLINSLKKLSSGEELEDTVNVEAVIRYFVVHNFVLNFDSYTGGMIHNYYLYEENGQMEMIPWDYNLAFGGFESAGGAKSLVNYPIDSPVSGGSTEDRPMIAWIFENEEYTRLYHQYFAEFISNYFDSGKFTEMIDSIKAMISPYVENDPTKFCTTEEFETGIDTLKEFCLLRAQSIQGQLDGSIGSTSETQDESTFIETGDIQIADMGNMNNAMGGGMGGPIDETMDAFMENGRGMPPGGNGDIPKPPDFNENQ